MSLIGSNRFVAIRSTRIIIASSGICSQSLELSIIMILVPESWDRKGMMVHDDSVVQDVLLLGMESRMANSPDYPWEEYKLLQSKVDGIGSFKFQVRGWAITLVSAFLVSGLSANIPPFAFLGGLVIVGLFFLLDNNQQMWQSAYVGRLAQLERKLVSGQAGRGKDLSPGVVRTTGAAVRELRRGRRLFLVGEAWIFYGLLALLTIGCTVYGFWRRTPEPPRTEVKITSPVNLNLKGEPK
jgi:hypothetical protein